MSHPGVALNKLVIAQAVWHIDFATDGHVIETQINQLRAKLHDDDHIWIETLHGVGYRFNVPSKQPSKK